MAEEIERLEIQCDTLALHLARVETANSERIPSAIVNRLAAGESPTTVWREYRNLTVQQLADKAGTTPNEVTLVELGKLKPNMERMAPIAQALDIDLDDLLPWSQDSDPS